MTENEIGRIVVDAAVAVHRDLGPGLLESVYEVVLAHELKQRGLNVERQVPIPIEYRGLRFNEGFCADIVVEGKVVLELKSIEQVSAVHKKQIHLSTSHRIEARVSTQLRRGIDEKRNHTSRQRP